MAKEKMQMVDDDEIENVGIMSGFLDDIDELMEEIEKEGQVEEGDDADMARILGRQPDSPEILMNNLRGDYRSIDARREELADRVGYNAAQQTPDEVLAMLQPIFAQQGIGALPMGGADVGALPMDAMTGMPPPGGMPPMDPAMMGMPPPAAQPMMNMPPEMMGMAPQGIAALPADQGSMPPLQMARGGVVQYFQDGSTEDAVTPFPMALSSSTRTVSQQMRDAADDELIQFAQRPPLEVPSLQAAMQDRVPMYEDLLGTGNTDAVKSSMLFDIAQAALGYASNTGPQGQPLRGSAAARLAGATQALPGQLGARLTAQQERDQAVRMLALQAAEKDLQGIREANTAQAREQRQLLGTFSRSLTDSETMGQASLTPARAQATVNGLARLITAGTATPAQMDLFASSMAMISTPKEVTNVLTGEVTTETPRFPAFVLDAVDMMNQRNPGGRPIVPLGGSPSTIKETPEPMDQNVPPSAIDPLVIANPGTENYGQSNVANFFNAADSATGFMPVLSAGLYRLPILNMLARDTANQEVQAQQFVTMATSALVEAFNANTDRFTLAEKDYLLENLNTLPSLIKDRPDSFRSTLFALDDLLQSKQEASLRNYRNNNLTTDVQLQFQRQAVAIHDARLLLGVPLHVNSLQDPRVSRIILRYPIGTSFIVRNLVGTDGRPQRGYVTEENKHAVLGITEEPL